MPSMERVVVWTGGVTAVWLAEVMALSSLGRRVSRRRRSRSARVRCWGGSHSGSVLLWQRGKTLTRKHDGTQQNIWTVQWTDAETTKENTPSNTEISIVRAAMPQFCHCCPNSLMVLKYSYSPYMSYCGTSCTHHHMSQPLNMNSKYPRILLENSV